MKPANFGGAMNARKIKALENLEQQLKVGMKQPKGMFLTLDMVELTPQDRERIKKEISILQSRIVSNDVAIARRTKKYRGA